jgi:hypothetical protein
MDKNSKNINSKSNDLLMQSLSKFYTTRSNIHKIIPIINGESEISLRLIDWFITNYSKKNQTIITKKLNNNNVIHLNVYLSYRSQLKSYSKTYFDPFRRRERIKFFYDDRNSIETTIGQLNMFRWILQSDILEYVADNRKEIEQDMIQTQKDNQQRKLNKDNIKVKVIETENGVITKTRKKRNELSKSVLKNMSQLSGKRTIQFD